MQFNSVKRFLVIFTVFIFFLTFISCEKNSTDLSKVKKEKRISTDFIIALLPVQNVFLQKKRYQPLADYLSSALNMRVKTKLLDSYELIYYEMLNKKVDAAFFGSLSYVVMKSKMNIESIARPVLLDNTSTYRGIIFTRKDKRITKDIATWKNKRIALVNKSTTAGYIFPKWYLLKHGIKDFQKYFRKIIFTGSHDAAVMEVLKGNADIGCAKDTVIKRLARENPIISKELVTLAVSVAVPSNNLAVRSSIDDRIKKKLREAFRKIKNDEEGRKALKMLGAKAFIRTEESEYTPVITMLKDLGLKPEMFIIEPGF